MVSVVTLSSQAANPLMSKFKTLHQTAPFEDVRIEHFLPAFEKGFQLENAEIAKITSNKAAPTFANTIEALEHCGEMLNRTASVFSTLLNNESNDQLMELSQKITAMYSEHSNNIVLNEALFQRIEAVYKQRESLNLTIEQKQLLENTFQSFLRSGATLKGQDREKYRELSTKLSQLTLNFGQNTLKSTNAFTKHFTDQAQLKGLPENALAIAAEKAKAKGLEGWIFDLTAPSYSAIQKYADDRALRQEFYIAYMQRATQGEYNNQPIIKEIVNTRLEIARLLGYNDYASYALERKMAKNSAGVYQLLDQLRDAYLPVAKQEVAEVQGFAIAYENNYQSLQAWDWSYYSNKLKDMKYKLNDEMLRPYFELENVKKGVFGLATNLYGLTFKKNDKIQVWHKDVDAYEVFDQDGSFLAVLYTDFFPRSGKSQGAWMSDIRSQQKINGKDQRPHITLTMNFTPATAEKPSLLTFSELTTFLHEFGHGIHGMLSDVNYASLSCTNVFRDFVELPSQIMENWACEKEFLDGFAVHYQTGEKIPMELIEKIKAADNFNAGYLCVRQLSFGYMDMAWHTLTQAFDGSAIDFENQASKCVQVLPVYPDCCMSASFGHLFSGGYAAGYYGYKWAEVLDADAYEYYTEKAVFDKERAASFRENILSKGGTEDPMVLYVRFRHQEPSIDALLRRNGIK